MRRKQTRFISGAPELVAEVASSSESVELHEKREDYQANGVQEYIVFLVRTRRVIWFVRRSGKFVELEPAANGVLCSRIFPGLWLDPAALLADDMRRVQKVLNQGLASAEHAKFQVTLEKAGCVNGSQP